MNATALDELDPILQICAIAANALENRSALDQISILLRQLIIFDHLIIYRNDIHNQHIEVLFARSLGRGKGRESHFPESEQSALQAMKEGRTLQTSTANVRITSDKPQIHTLAVPSAANPIATHVLVLIRFGDRRFQDGEIIRAEIVNYQISRLIESSRTKSLEHNQTPNMKDLFFDDDFIATISHELQNPLGFIKGYTTTLLRPDKTWDEKTRIDFLKIIDQECDRLQELLSNILDTARLKSGKFSFRFQPLRIEPLIRDVIARVKLHNPSICVELSTKNINNPVYGDAERLVQVILNLINNSIKYAVGSPIFIEIDEDNEVKVIISDKGPGIPKRYIAHIFERYFRNPEVAPNVHGTGLGLFIAHEIIKAHNGAIRVESEEGYGAKFIISLPIYSRNQSETEVES